MKLSARRRVPADKEARELISPKTVDRLGECNPRDGHRPIVAPLHARCRLLMFAWIRPTARSGTRAARRLRCARKPALAPIGAVAGAADPVSPSPDKSAQGSYENGATPGVSAHARRGALGWATVRFAEGFRGWRTIRGSTCCARKTQRSNRRRHAAWYRRSRPFARRSTRGTGSEPQMRGVAYRRSRGAVAGTVLSLGGNLRGGRSLRESEWSDAAIPPRSRNSCGVRVSQDGVCRY